MGKSKAVILSAMVALGGFSLVAPGFAADQPQTATTSTVAKSSFDVDQVVEDFRTFKIGDVVPDLYRSKSYEITQWNLRHLPAPEANSHWTYMGGDYVQISETDGKVMRILSGDIFYRH